ncbi:MAG: copper amine oxidase N-terminal domain-containing protein [Candidatus Pristimantibacillus sp.]
MLRKLICLLLIICLVSTVPVISAAEQPIEFYVNNEKINGINPIMKSGVMYVPYRDFFNALGYKVSYDPDTEQISGIINGSELFFWAGEDLVEYNGRFYLANEPIPIIKGRVYLPIRLIGNLANYSVSYDKQIVNLYTYGFGQETAVRDLVTKYYETRSPKL